MVGCRHACVDRAGAFTAIHDGRLAHFDRVGDIARPGGGEALVAAPAAVAVVTLLTSPAATDAIAAAASPSASFGAPLGVARAAPAVGSVGEEAARVPSSAC